MSARKPFAWLLCLLLALALLPVPSLAEEARERDGNLYKTGLPILHEPETFRVAINKHNQIVKPMSELLGILKIQEETNILLDIIEIRSDGGAEKVNLMIATQDLPDAFLMCAPDVEKNGSLGIYLALEDLIEEYGPNIMANFDARTDMRKLITAPDGHIYGIPRYYESGQHNIGGGLLVNTAWLEALGVKAPETIDEFLEICRMVSGKDLNGNGKDDEFAFGAIGGMGTEGFENLFGAFGHKSNTQLVFVDDDGAVQFTYTTDAYKQGIAFMHQMSQDKLLDPEMFTHNQSAYRAKAKENTYLFYHEWAQYITFGAEENDYEFIPALKGADGRQNYNWNATNPDVRGMVITSACKNPAVMVRLADYIQDPINSLEFSEGFFGQNILPQENGTYDRKNPMEIHEVTSGNEPSVLLRETYALINPGAWDIQRTAKQALYEPVASKANTFPAIMRTADEAFELATLGTDIRQYVDQTRAKWVVEGGIEAEWDAYVQQLRNMGLERFLEIHTGMYQRYLSN